MTTIKPPGGPGAPPPVERPAEGPRPGSGDFRAQVGEVSRLPVGEGQPAAVGSLAATLAAEIQSGRLEVREAIDRLVQRQLSAGPVASLPAARRAELEAALRAALEEDPTLAAMQKDLARGH